MSELSFSYFFWVQAAGPTGVRCNNIIIRHGRCVEVRSGRTVIRNEVLECDSKYMMRTKYVMRGNQQSCV